MGCNLMQFGLPFSSSLIISLPLQGFNKKYAACFCEVKERSSFGNSVILTLFDLVIYLGKNENICCDYFGMHRHFWVFQANFSINKPFAGMILSGLRCSIF